jgi:hypothetical protein
LFGELVDERGSLGLDVGQLKFCEDKLLLDAIVQLTRDPLAFVILGLEHFRFAIPQRPRGLFLLAQHSQERH